MTIDESLHITVDQLLKASLILNVGLLLIASFLLTAWTNERTYRKTANEQTSMYHAAMRDYQRAESRCATAEANERWLKRRVEAMTDGNDDREDS